MTSPRRIYLDNAATSWPKPAAVYAAMDAYQRENGAPAGRGAYDEAQAAERLVAGCRRTLAELLGGVQPERIIFTHNGTDSLNLALHGILRAGDHVVTTVCEHNSVLRPLRQLSQQMGVRVTYVGCDSAGIVQPQEMAAAIEQQTRLIVMTHASNVTGAIQPAEEVGRIASQRGILFLLDAAQSLGHIPVLAKDLGFPLIAAPGHKGLFGPLGTGMLYVPPGVDSHLQPTRQGGTGTRSDEDAQPASLPDRYESGNLNVPGIVGLGEGARAVLREGVSAIAERERDLCQAIYAGLEKLPGVKLYGPQRGTDRLGVVSFNIEGYEPQELAALLDSTYRIQIRAGIHCAPKMHAALGTLPGGTARLSVNGLFTTPEEIAATTNALGEIAGD